MELRNREAAVANPPSIGEPHLYGDRPLRFDVPRSSYSVFSDDVWTLEPVLVQEHAKVLTLNFRAIPDRYRQTAKELMHVLLAVEPPDGLAQLAPASIHSEFSAVKPFFKWLDSHSGKQLVDLGRDDLAHYLLAMNKAHAGNGPLIQSRLRAARHFFVYRSVLPGDHIREEPFQIPGWSGYRISRPNTENQTKRIPEEVLHPLISWATSWVEDYSADIVAARQEFLQLEGRGRARPVSERTMGRDTARKVSALRSVLDRYIKEGRPLPGGAGGAKPRTNPVNRLYLSREADCLLDSEACQKLIAEASAIVGVDDDAYLWSEVQDTGLLRLLGPKIRRVDVPELTNLLATACYVLIAFYSGMREAEIKSLLKGCLTEERDTSGKLSVLRLDGLAFKGEASPNGVPATWVAGKPVAGAVRVLEQLLPKGTKALFARYSAAKPGRRARDRPAISGQKTNQDLNRFVAWINRHSDRDGNLDLVPIPDVDGCIWKLSTRQFRRTLAWYIARQPGGSIAGAIQFRHHSIQMFEGYAGTSSSGFRAEVEGEEAILRGEYLLELAAGKSENLGGPAAKIAATRAEAFASVASFGGVVTDNPKQLQRLVKDTRAGVYPGQHVVCVFDPSKALCRRSADSGPNLSGCVPLKCKNVALDSKNREHWRGEKDRAMAALEFDLAPFVESKLRQRVDEIDQLLA